MKYLDSLIKQKDIVTDEGEIVEEYELSKIEESAFKEWASHFRQNYCEDELLELFVNGTGMTKQEYLLSYKYYIIPSIFYHALVSPIMDDHFYGSVY